MRLRFLGCHHTETAETRLSSLMVDQDLVIDAGAITSTLTTDEQSQIRALLLTHQHLDHIRDVPTLALGGISSGATLPIFSATETLKSVKQHLLNGSVYPDFTQIPTVEEPRLRLIPLEPDKEVEVCGKMVTPVSTVHTEGSVGYHIQSQAGASFFYSGDTNGEGLADVLDAMSPDLAIVEVTFPNSQEPLAPLTNHMTPSILQQELERFLKGSGRKLPRLIVVHMNTQCEPEILSELQLLADRFDAPITPAREGMVTEVLGPAMTVV